MQFLNSIHKLLRRSRIIKTGLACVLCCIYALMLGCRTPSADWSGRWRLDPSRSDFHGPVFTILIEKDGTYRWNDGNASFAFLCDGKFKSIGNNRMQACFRRNATTLELLRNEDGVMTNAFKWELSNQGMTFTSTKITYSSDGPSVSAWIVASRISGDSDFAGQWRDTSYLQQHAVMVLKLDHQVLQVSYPSVSLFYSASLDGTDTVVHGPRTEDKTTYSARVVRRREISFLTKHYGKVQSEGKLSLSNDGRSIMESWSNPNNPADRGMLVYKKE